MRDNRILDDNRDMRGKIYDRTIGIEDKISISYDTGYTYTEIHIQR